MAATATLAGLVACKRTPATPPECVVWSVTNGVNSGQVYVDEGVASFSQGATRRASARLDGDGHVKVAVADGELDAARWNGQTIEILYIEDSRFVSDPIAASEVVFYNGIFRALFRYNAKCTREDAVVGSVALFTVVFPPGEPTSF